MPKLWNETIASHRTQVREAILDTTASLAAERGPASVTMSQVAGQVGIGRATLYKYFPDVDAILAAWHHRQITHHLAQLAEARDRESEPGARLHAALGAYAEINRQRTRHVHQPHGADLAMRLHQGDEVATAHRELHRLFRDLLRDAAASGDIRDDVVPEELARYCVHALTAATGATSKAAARRLVDVIMAGLRSG